LQLESHKDLIVIFVEQIRETAEMCM